jgi:YD repeat-containing protein
MTKAREEILGALVGVSAATETLLRQHHSLRKLIIEGISDRTDVAAATAKLGDLKIKAEKERIKIRQLKDRERRKRELEKIRKTNEKERNMAATAETNEVVKITQKAEVVTDSKGRVIGYVRRNKDRATYYDASGRVVAHEFGMNTYDSKGGYVGAGKQGMRLLEEI